MENSENQFEDEFIDEEETNNGPAALAKLRDKLRSALAEKQEHLDGWQRARADLANFKRDELQRSEEQDIRSKTKFAEALIPALDSFEMALQDKHLQQSDANLKKGIEAVHTNLLKALERLGIVRFDPLGEKFDPHTHEALREVPTEDETQDHFIESIHRAGYRIGERIIRPAQVSVYTYQK